MTLADDVGQWIRARKPGQVLLLGSAARFGAQALDNLIEMDSQHLAKDDRICDVALIDGEPFSDEMLTPIIARVRDVNARALLLWLPAARQLSASALGLTLLRAYDDGKLYGYEIATYKTPPDWLNANYWANPQMWDKKRW